MGVNTSCTKKSQPPLPIFLTNVSHSLFLSQHLFSLTLSSLYLGRPWPPGERGRPPLPRHSLSLSRFLFLYSLSLSLLSVLPETTAAVATAPAGLQHCRLPSTVDLSHRARRVSSGECSEFARSREEHVGLLGMGKWWPVSDHGVTAASWTAAAWARGGACVCVCVCREWQHRYRHRSGSPLFFKVH